MWNLDKNIVISDSIQGHDSKTKQVKFSKIVTVTIDEVVRKLVVEKLQATQNNETSIQTQIYNNYTCACILYIVSIMLHALCYIQYRYIQCIISVHMHSIANL